MVGANRIIPGVAIIHPLGSPVLNAQEERKLRRAIVIKALEALQTELSEQRVFPVN